MLEANHELQLIAKALYIWHSIYKTYMFVFDVLLMVLLCISVDIICTFVFRHCIQ